MKFPEPEAIENYVPELGPGETPLQYMLRVVRDDNVDPVRRDRMAIAAAPYCHPRVAEGRVGKKDITANRARALGDGELGKAQWGDDLADLPH
jgi:hypothetical protein